MSAENKVYAVLSKVIFYREIEFLSLFRAEVANRTIDEFESRLDRFLADFLDLVLISESFDMLVRAKFKINLVRIVDEFLRKILADELRKFAADFMAQREFAVGKRTRAGKTGRDMAVRLAVSAFAAERFRAHTALYRLSLFDNAHFFVATVAQKFDRRKDSGRSCTDYTNIVFFHCCLQNLCYGISPRLSNA